MSRIGKLPIKIPTAVDVTNDTSILKVKGKFGTLERIIPEIIGVEETDGDDAAPTTGWDVLNDEAG